MNILLVDDNIYVLEGLKAGIDYQALGIDRVFEAKNVREAKAIMESEDIPLVLTDIEMPGGTGLQLLEWINQTYPDVVTLFCTSYADFDYARKALELHSFDYYLKPIRYDSLQQLLARAAAEVCERQKIRQKQLFSEYWLDNLSVQKRHFWQDALLNIDSFDEDELEFLADSAHLPYSKEDKFTLGLLCFEKGKSKMEGFSENMERFVMHNMMEELMENTGVCIEVMMKTRRDTWALILSHGPEVTKTQMHQVFSKIVDAIHQTIHCPVNGYYSYRTAFSNMRSRYIELEAADQVYVCDSARVVDIDTYQMMEPVYESLDMTDWESLFRSGHKKELLAAIGCYLEKNEQNSRGARALLGGVRISVMQMVYIVLWEKQIDAGYLFGAAVYDQLRQDALNSVHGLLAYLEAVFDTALAYMGDAKKEEDAILKVKNYIDRHFCEDITRENLGEIVYLSSGYLASSFKKQTGKSLGGYVIEKRMEKAKQLLREGKLSVSEVASAVGYDNFTYFSRLFKTKAGKSPKDYRKDFI